MEVYFIKITHDCFNEMRHPWLIKYLICPKEYFQLSLSCSDYRKCTLSYYTIDYQLSRLLLEASDQSINPVKQQQCKIMREKFSYLHKTNKSKFMITYEIVFLNWNTVFYTIRTRGKGFHVSIDLVKQKPKQSFTMLQDDS